MESQTQQCQPSGKRGGNFFLFPAPASLCSPVLSPEQDRALQTQAETAPQQAQAQLDQAKLNLSYTKIVSPADGIVTRKSVEIDQISPAEAGLRHRPQKIADSRPPCIGKVRQPNLLFLDVSSDSR